MKHFNSKSQTSTEYLIISAVVIVIALIVVGVGGLYRGNTGTTSSLDCDAGGSALPGDDSTCESGGRDKRMLYLSNEAEIWDLSGNIFQWVDEIVIGIDKPDPGGEWGGDWDSITDWGAYSGTLLGPSDASWTRTEGMGYYWKGTADGNTYAFLRGSGSVPEGSAGVYSLRLSLAPSFSHSIIGFHCSFSG